MLDSESKVSINAMMPGVIFGMYASVFASGNPHGGEYAPMLIVAGIINFIFYTVLCGMIFSVYGKLPRNASARVLTPKLGVIPDDRNNDDRD